MKTMFSTVRRALVSTTAILALAAGLVGCATDIESDSLSENVYEVAVSANGRDIAIDVNVSGSSAIEYEQLMGVTLDKDEVGALVGERIRKAVDDGLIELPTDPEAQVEVIFDIERNDGNPGLQPAGEVCVVSWGIASYYYKIVVRDSYGCRYYDAYDYYDILRNNCNNTSTLQYLYSKQYGPYWGC